MYRRLATAFILLLLGAFALLGVAVALSVEPPLRARLLLVVAAGAGLSMVAALAYSAWLARQITRPLDDLTKAAEYLGAGEGAPRVLPETEDEVGALGHTFNRMCARLAQRISRLEADRQELTAILGGMVEGVVGLDAGQRIVFANERAAQLLELPAGACVGRRLWEVVRQRPLLDVAQRALSGTEPRSCSSSTPQLESAGSSGKSCGSVPSRRWCSVRWLGRPRRTRNCTGTARRHAASRCMRLACPVPSGDGLAAPFSCCTTPANCAAWNAIARSSSPTCPTS